MTLHKDISTRRVRYFDALASSCRCHEYQVNGRLNLPMYCAQAVKGVFMKLWNSVFISLLLMGCQSTEYQSPESKNYSRESALQTPENPLMEDYNRVKNRQSMPYNPRLPTHPSNAPQKP